ncbi:uracil-DNA glycosylase [Dyadobacter tibetensis]|uniref:uracil-DNA glycosylase n=1 Tax=Dyadobacter tibetensis TaxID=1211851 RepID=UPI000471E82F|nr:uracil-DNA glycosylase [Dyadobacter tibetensis]
MEVNIAESWKLKMSSEFGKPYFGMLTDKVRAAYRDTVVFPRGGEIFKAFELCSFEDCRVVILGQDPYHGAGQANGLSFSVNNGIPIPPSLRNIFKEIEADLNIPMPNHGNLERWAKQGVLLLNATLTVPASTPGGHQKWGWEHFTDAVIATLSREKEHLVFLLWGSYAKKKVSLINQEKHLILTARHPSPMSANQGGWFGTKHFSQTNRYLQSHGFEPIQW